MTQHKTTDEIASEMLQNHEGPLGKSFAAPGVVAPTGPGGHVGNVMAAMGIEPQPDPRTQVMQKSGQPVDRQGEPTMVKLSRDADPELLKAHGEGYQPTGETPFDEKAATLTTITAFHSVDEDVDSEGDEPQDSIHRTEDMVARESAEKYIDWWRNPDAVQSSTGLTKAELTPAKAKEILHDGTVHGNAITDQQRKYFGAVASGGLQKSLDTPGLDSLEALMKGGYSGKGSRTGSPGNYQYHYDVAAGEKKAKQHRIRERPEGLDRETVTKVRNATEGSTLTVQLKEKGSDKWESMQFTMTKEGWKSPENPRVFGSGELTRLATGKSAMYEAKDMKLTTAEHPDDKMPDPHGMNPHQYQNAMVDYQERVMARDKAKKSLDADAHDADNTGTETTGLTAMVDYLEKAEGNPDFKSWMMGIYKKDSMKKGGGPFYGPRGGKWADAQHKVPWDDKRNVAGKKQKEAKEHDAPLAEDLHLTVVNESALHNQMRSIGQNLINKMAKGNYDHAQAAKLWNYAADAGAKLYKKSFGVSIDPATRMAVARELSDAFYEEAMEGEWGHAVNKTNLKRMKDAGVNTMKEFEAHVGKEGKAKHKEQTEKSMSATEILEDYLGKSGAAAGLPTGTHTNLKKQKSSAVSGGSADGGELAGVGTTSGDIGAHPGPGQDADGQATGTSVGNQKLSADDADDEGQMSPHKKPIERTTKSMTSPQGQRDQVAHDHAVAVSRLRKSRDAAISIDEQASELVKSEGFYTGGSPELNLHQDVDLRSVQSCGACKGTFAKSLSACPGCGYGQVGHRVAPGQNVGGDVSVRSNHDPVLKKSQPVEDVSFGRPTPVRVIG